MSYKQMIRWNRSHPKGTRQPIILSAASGFWPSGEWLENDFQPYVRACAEIDVEPVDCEMFYRATTRRGHIPRQACDYAAMTKAGILGK